MNSLRIPAQVKTLLLLFTISLLGSSVVFAYEQIVIGGLDGIDPNEGEHNRIVLALSGGGARGLASIGVIKAFEEKNIEVYAIAGTSMGGIIGGLYASGYSPDELSSIVSNIDFNDFFVDAPRRQTMFLTQRQEYERHLLTMRFDNFRPVIPQGWTGGQKITAVLNRLTTTANYRCSGDFTKLEIPFKTVATDVVSGKEIVIDNGSISEAMRATMAFPLALTGVERGNQLLMDGGMVTPVPVEIAKSMNDSGYLVVAVNTASKLDSKDNLRNPVDIAGQVTTIMTADKLKSQLTKADYVVEPKLGNFESGDFNFKDSLIEMGYQSGIEAADSLISSIKGKKNSSSVNIENIIVQPDFPELQKRADEELNGQRISKSELISKLKKIVHDLGYFRLKANLKVVSHQKSGSSGVIIELSAVDDPKTSEYRFTIDGSTLYESDSLIKILIDNNDALSLTDFKKGLDRIVELYRSGGYDIAFIRSAEIDYVNKVVKILIDEAIIKSIDVEDNDRTKDWLVRSYFPLKTAQPYSTDGAATGIDNIYGTNLFEQAMVDLVPYRDGARVRIRVKERHYTQLRLGWHWDDDYKSEQYLEILDDNIRGMGLEVLAHAQYAEDRQNYYGQLKLDRIWFSYITARIKGYHTRLDRYIYDGRGRQIDDRQERKFGMEISLGQQVQRFGTVRGAAILEKVRTRYDRTQVLEEFQQNIIHLESEIETFDRIPFTNTGKKHHIEVRFAGEFLGGEVEYTRFFSSLEGYIPIGKYINYHPKFSIGISGSILPPSEQFYIGGANSFVGYRAYEFAGDKIILMNNELRFRLPLSLYLIGRYDVGEVYVQTDQIKLRNLRHGAGIFLAFNSPLGPFELGYGAASFDNDRFYVNVGIRF
jgi:NTE family protein